MNLFNNCLFTVFAFIDLMKADLIPDVFALGLITKSSLSFNLGVGNI